jgi:hypothetical protein
MGFSSVFGGMNPNAGMDVGMGYRDLAGQNPVAQQTQQMANNPIYGQGSPFQPPMPNPGMPVQSPGQPGFGPAPIGGGISGGGKSGMNNDNSYIMPGDRNQWQQQRDTWNNSDLAKQYNDFNANQRQLGGQAWGEAYKSVLGPNWNPEINAQGQITNLPTDFNQFDAAGEYYKNLTQNDPRFQNKMFGQDIGADQWLRSTTGQGLKSTNPDLYNAWKASQSAAPGERVWKPDTPGSPIGIRFGVQPGVRQNPLQGTPMQGPGQLVGGPVDRPIINQPAQAPSSVFQGGLRPAPRNYRPPMRSGGILRRRMR